MNSQKALRWIAIAGLVVGVAWYSEAFDFRSAEEREEDNRREAYCGYFVNSGAIERHEIEECANSWERFNSAADRAAKIDAARDAEVIAEVSIYLTERANSLNMDAFKPLGPTKIVPSFLSIDADTSERPHYDRRYLDVVDLHVMSDTNDDTLDERFTLFARPLTSTGEDEDRMLPDPAGVWTQALDQLTYACPWSGDSGFHGCRARIFFEAAYNRFWGWEPATSFMLLKPINETALFAHYQAKYRSRW